MPFNLLVDGSVDAICYDIRVWHYNYNDTEIITLTSCTHSTRIAEPGMLWLDTYFEWIAPTSDCCGYDNETHLKCKIGEGEDHVNVESCVSACVEGGGDM